MKRKIAAAILCLVMAVPMLAGCGGSQADGSSDAGNQGSVDGNETDGGDVSDNNGEITEIVWQYPSAGNLGAGFQDVEDALNEMLVRDIGVRVRFETSTLMNAQKEASLMVSSGEQLDICLTAFTGLGALVDSELIIPLDDLLDSHGQDIKEHCGILLDGCTYGQNTYGVPVAYMKTNTYGYAIRTDICEKYGIAVDENKNYTLEDLDEIFTTIKEGEGENFYCIIPNNKVNEPLNNSYIPLDKVSGSLSGGVLMLNRSFEDLTLYNLFETDEYKEYCSMMYRWAQKGYISPDAAVTTEEGTILMSTGNYLGMPYWIDPAAKGGLESSIPYEMTLLKTNDGYAANNGGQGIMWNISITSANPEKAMETLNYIYQNKEAAWLLQFGLEGETYEVVEESEDGISIQYLSEDTSTLPYYQPYGIYGDRLEWPVLLPAPINLNKLLIEHDNSVPQSRYSPAIGYSFVQTDVSTEISAVNTVIEQYTPSFNCGTLDPEKALPEFISALKAAGIDKIIAENQRQLDEWAAIAE